MVPSSALPTTFDWINYGLMFFTFQAPLGIGPKINQRGDRISLKVSIGPFIREKIRRVLAKTRLK